MLIQKLQGSGLFTPRKLFISGSFVKFRYCAIKWLAWNFQIHSSSSSFNDAKKSVAVMQLIISREMLRTIMHSSRMRSDRCNGLH